MESNKVKPTVITLSSSLDASVLEVLADIICGDGEDKFPKYRSSYYLTQFFQQIGIDVRHDGSTRRIWVLDVLNNLSPPDLEKVIKRLADPKEYKGELELIKQANSELNRALGLEGLAIRYRKQGPVIVELQPTSQEQASHASASVTSEGAKEDKHIYYSQRKGGDNAQGYDNAGLLEIVKNDMQSLVTHGYFNEYLGMNLQQGLVKDVRLTLIKETGKSNLSPYVPTFKYFTITGHLDDFFDIIEFLYRNVSKPNEDTITIIEPEDWLEPSGFTYDEFDREAGKEAFREAINEAFAGWREHYELSSEGFIELKVAGEQKELIEAWEKASSSPIADKIKKAIRDYKRSRDNIEARQDAVRTLADVLEELKKSKKLKLDSKDESDLFNIANNFGIRHANPQQKTNYDHDIWLEWMFFFYLSTINAVMRLLEKQD